MLEHVTANQTRFVAPGLTSDPRGIALGRVCVVLLASLDRVVGFFRGLSDTSHLDDLLAGLHIYQVKSPLQAREFVVQIPTATSHLADGIRAVASLMGGLTFTGSAKHFVKYRDSSSPMGYDVDNLQAGQGDFILYHSDFVQEYQTERELSFAQLIFNLSLEVQRNDRLAPQEPALLRVEPGLWRVVVGYLHRRNCPCQVAACQRPDRGSGLGAGQPFYLVRCQLPPRLERLLRHTPGVEVHRIKEGRVAVELGYTHPVNLNSCSSIFSQERFYIFSGARKTLERVDSAPVFVQAGALVDLNYEGRSPEIRPTWAQPAARLDLELRLLPGGGAPLSIGASRIPWENLDWLKKLVYVLPPSALEQTQICFTRDHAFLVSQRQIDSIPLGQLFYSAAPGVFVPLGYELVPRVNPVVLAQHLGQTQETYFFFTPEGGAPTQLQQADFFPLSRRVLASTPIQRPAALDPASAPSPAPSVANDAVGLFPLWGFQGATKEGK